MGKKYRFVATLVLILAALVSSSCHPGSTGKHRQAAPRPPHTDAERAFLSDEAWRNRLSFWLRVGYVEPQGGVAAFAGISPDFLRYPNLYSTYGTVETLTELGIQVNDPDAISEWIDSIQKEDGSYADRFNKAPPVLQTYWAVATLRSLGFSPKHPKRIVGFLESLREKSGLFAPGADVGGSIESQELFATDYAIRTLLTLNPSTDDWDGIEEMRTGCIPPLRSYIARQLNEVRPDMNRIETSDLLEAILTLARVDPALLPEGTDRFLQKCAGEVGTLHGSPMLFGEVNDLVDVLDRFSGISITQASLRSYVRKQVVPFFRPGKGNVGPVDPLLAYQAARLLNRSGLLDESITASLQEQMNRYRIEGGWITFVHPMPNVDSTCSAMVIARHIGFTGYDHQGVAEYFRRYIRSAGTGNASAWDVYCAVLGLKEMGQGLDSGTSKSLEKALSRISTTAKSRGLAEIALIGETLGWRFPNEMRDRFAQAARQAKGDMTPPNIKRLFDVVVLQKAAGRYVLSNEEVERYLNDLRSDRYGGFKISPDAPVSDVASTFSAVRIGKLLSLPMNQQERDSIFRFLASCKYDYGFGFVPLDSKYASEAGSDFSATAKAFLILELLGKP